MTNTSRVLLFWLLLSLLATACLSPDENRLATEVAATVRARQTEQPQVTADTPLLTVPARTAQSTSTSKATAAPARTSTRQPTPMHTPRPDPTTTPTPQPTTTPTAAPCLPDARFTADVTIPDGTQFAPGEGFTKTWRMTSSGCAAWPAGSVWAFDSGDQMSAPASVPVSDTPLGGDVDISVDMVAPGAPGSYKGFWQMQAPDGTRFGDRVYVLIVVPADTPTPRACPANPALVEVTNELSVQLTVELTGPENARFLLPAGAMQRYCMTPGTYTFTARATGYNPLTGEKTFGGSSCDCWWFYSGFGVHPLCHCDSNAALYGPLP